MADKVFPREFRPHREDCGCSPTGRYKGGHDSGAGYTASVVIEERTCGAWLVVTANAEVQS